ncbi:MAG: peptidylprolyl isomerase [Myxococcota bacterium]
MTGTEAHQGSRRRRGLGRTIIWFVLLGGLLFLAERLWRGPEPNYVVVVGPKQIATLEQGWAGRLGETPEPDLLDSLIGSHVDDELLIAQAHDLGWHRNDAIVQRRLIQNQRFLAGDEDVSDVELLERAYTQGMDESDIVVRRRLLERMRLLIAAAARERSLSDSELETYLNRHPERFERPERSRLTQIYLSRDARGSDLESDAAALAARLQQEEMGPEQARFLGDPFLIALDLPLSTEAALARQLGTEFAAGAMAAPVDQWSGPISSSYGLHFVWPHEKVPSEIPPLAEVRSRVTGEVQREREEQALRDHLAALRNQARIEILRPEGAR